MSGHTPGTDGDLLTEETALRSDGSRIPSHQSDALLSKAPFRFSGGQAKMAVCEHTLSHGGDACENETDACRSLGNSLAQLLEESFRLYLSRILATQVPAAVQPSR